MDSDVSECFKERVLSVIFNFSEFVFFKIIRFAHQRCCKRIVNAIIAEADLHLYRLSQEWEIIDFITSFHSISFPQIYYKCGRSAIEGLFVYIITEIGLHVWITSVYITAVYAANHHYLVCVYDIFF